MRDYGYTTKMLKKYFGFWKGVASVVDLFGVQNNSKDIWKELKLPKSTHEALMSDRKALEEDRKKVWK